MFRLERPNLFPEAIAKWLSNQEAQAIQELLAASLVRACLASDPPVSIIEATEAAVEQLDNRYFDLQEQGKADESQQAFRAARLSAAVLSLKKDDLEGALYEFFHSRGASEPQAFIEELESKKLD